MVAKKIKNQKVEPIAIDYYKSPMEKLYDVSARFREQTEAEKTSGVRIPIRSVTLEALDCIQLVLIDIESRISKLEKDNG